MVDELTVSLRELGADVVVISPYYHVDRKGKGDYLVADGIVYTGRTVSVWVGNEKLTLGVHEGRVNGVHLLFLHHSEVFPRCGTVVVACRTRGLDSRCFCNVGQLRLCACAVCGSWPGVSVNTMCGPRFVVWSLSLAVHRRATCVLTPLCVRVWCGSMCFPPAAGRTRTTMRTRRCVC